MNIRVGKDFAPVFVITCHSTYPLKCYSNFAETN